MVAQAAALNGWKFSFQDSVPAEEIYSRLVSTAASGASVILVPDPELEETMLEVSNQYPQTIFVLLKDKNNAPAKSVFGNVTSLHVREDQEGIIAGTMAAERTASGKVGFFFSIPPEGEDVLYRSFADTIQKANEKYNTNISVSDALYVNSYENFQAVPMILNQLIMDGTDVIFTDDSNLAMITSRTADRYNAMNNGKTISVITRSFPPVTRSDSIIMKLNSGIALFLDELMKSIDNGTYQGGIVVSEIENGMLGAEFSENIPEKTMEAYYRNVSEWIQ